MYIAGSADPTAPLDCETLLRSSQRNGDLIEAGILCCRAARHKTMSGPQQMEAYVGASKLFSEFRTRKIETTPANLETYMRDLDNTFSQAKTSTPAGLANANNSNSNQSSASSSKKNQANNNKPTTNKNSNKTKIDFASIELKNALGQVLPVEQQNKRSCFFYNVWDIIFIFIL